MTTAAAHQTPGVDPVDERLPAGPTVALALQHLRDGRVGTTQELNPLVLCAL